ncbi:MAG: arginine deiminase [Clostridia bacterium]|nr:arginine deiminase [Clostridia bacterium]
MRDYISLRSEIGKLNTVMLHRPGVEIDQLMPDYLEQMLSEDIPYLPAAQAEHDRFADVLKSNGVTVLYLEELFCQAVRDDAVKAKFIDDYVIISDVQADSLKDVIREYLSSKSVRELFYEVCKGIKRADLEHWVQKPLPLLVKDDYPFFTDPVSSMYFTRDISICIANGMIISSMSKPFRRRETLLMRYIHDYHPDFMSSPLWYSYDYGYGCEGGDHLVLSNKVLAIGYSERTSLGAIEHEAKMLLRNGYERIIVFNLPKSRKYMHLDVLCTMVDYDKFIVNPEVYAGRFDLYELTLKRDGSIDAQCKTESLESVLKHALGVPSVQFIQVGGGDRMTAAREHYNMGSNSLTIAPGKVITYERNVVTNELLASNGVEVLTIPGTELCKGRGGPRCMSMPINRSAV